MKKYEKKIGDSFECGICPNRCVLNPGETGKCSIRECSEDGIYLEGYGRISNMSVEPIEKKPIFHFKPNSRVLSIGSYGCSLRCSYCQNSEIAWVKMESKKCKYFNASAISHLAQSRKCQGVFFTYNEPTISYEFLMDVSEKCRKMGLFFGIKTNAFVESEPWQDICDACDVMNIDWKLRYENASGNEIVLRNIETAINKRIHVEISIPLYHDIKVGEEDAILHFFGYWYPDIPAHLLKIFPTETYDLAPATDTVIIDFWKRMKERMRFVYVENIFTEDGRLSRTTVCPSCKKVVAVRDALVTNISTDPSCSVCKSIFVE